MNRLKVIRISKWIWRVEEWTAAPVNENIIRALRKSIAISPLSNLGVVDFPVYIMLPRVCVTRSVRSNYVNRYIWWIPFQSSIPFHGSFIGNFSSEDHLLCFCFNERKRRKKNFIDHRFLLFFTKNCEETKLCRSKD